MTLTLELTPEQERRLSEEAASRGLSPADYALMHLVSGAGQPRIRVDEQGQARIVDTGTKVVEVVRNFLGGMTPEQIAGAFPHLSPAAIYAALSYYYDHRNEMDAQIAAQRDFEQRMRAEAGPSPIATRLRAEGKLPPEDAAA